METIFAFAMPGIGDLMVITLFVSVFIAPQWILYSKASQPGWAVLIPIYNLVIFNRIIGKPWWWIFLWLIPILNFIFIIWSTNLFVKRFGRSEGFTFGVLILPFIFLPILAFGDSKYRD